jgi:hypothetical protein
MSRSFAELEVDEQVKASEVCEVLERYASIGVAIAAAVVVEIINRTEPNLAQLDLMKTSAEKGKNNLLRLRHARDAAAYERVIRHISSHATNRIANLDDVDSDNQVPMDEE